MILSEYDRRWAEIRLYTFCIKVYELRNKSIDIMDMVELVCSIGDIDQSKIKPIIQAMLSDTYYQATRREIILIGTAKGISANQLGKYLEISRQGVTQYIDRNKELFTPLPRCNIEDDYAIINFLKSLEKIIDTGKMGYGTIN